MQLSKTATKIKGKDVYKVRIDNASPLILNGVAVLGNESNTDELPEVLSGISLLARQEHDRPGDRRDGRATGPEEGRPRRSRRT